MELETERLKLRRATKKDAAFILELLNSPGWIEFIGDRNIKNLEDASSYIESALDESFKEYGFGLLLMERKSDSKPLGLCGLLKREFLAAPDLGFAIAPGFTRQGYTYEASKKVLAYADEVLQIKKTLAFTNEKNVASQKLLLKLNMALVEKRWLKSYDEVCWIYRQQG